MMTREVYDLERETDELVDTVCAFILDAGPSTDAMSAAVRNALTNAYQFGKFDSMLDAVDANQLADELELTSKTIRVAAARFGVGRSIGTGNRSTWIFSGHDADLLRLRLRKSSGTRSGNVQNLRKQKPDSE